MVVLLNVFKAPILHIFTQNPAILGMASAALFVSLILEPVRAINCIVIPGLKGAGDVRFPVFMGMIFMWGVGVCGAFVLGLGLGLGLVGVWIAMTCDESVRGLIMLLRWRGGAWKRKSLVTVKEAEAP
jgi:Na+-driven multidrug efflux pump